MHDQACAVYETDDRTARADGVVAFGSADVRAVVAAVLDTGVEHDALIRRAAAGLATVCAAELRTRFGAVYGRRVVLLVGTGNNGADVLFAGARLRRRGVRVDALLVGKTAYGPALRAFGAARGRVVRVRDEQPGGVQRARSLLRRADLVVDGIVGDRGRGGLRGTAGALVEFLGGLAEPPAVVAADLPSGVDPDSGALTGCHVRADVTVTFDVAKPCLLLPPAAAVAGRLVLVDVGLPPIEPARRVVQKTSAVGVARGWPVPAADGHKYTRGVLGVVAGSDAYPGAAVLSCLGAVRAGVGMVRYVGPQRVADQVLTAMPEVVSGAGRVQAWLLGPGVAPGTDQDAAVAAALDFGLPCVVDAGALVACVTGRVAARELQRQAAAWLLLTPHAGELADLLVRLGHDVDRAAVEAEPARHARTLAVAADATVLLKGATTVITGVDGPVGVVREAPPWLATAGAGDVLAGIAGALMAAGLDAYTAGIAAAFVHGRAATRASGGGPIAASDVAAAVPATIVQLLSEDA